LLDGLEHIHAEGWFHGDLKLDNLLLSDTGSLKISDFGLSSADTKVLHGVVGTPAYMAPEITEDKVYAGSQVDLYAASIIIYILVTGRPPFNSAKSSDFHFKFIVD
jgi:serine/threonine protein kinase